MRLVGSNLHEPLTASKYLRSNLLALHHHEYYRVNPLLRFSIEGLGLGLESFETAFCVDILIAW